MHIIPKPGGSKRKNKVHHGEYDNIHGSSSVTMFQDHHDASHAPKQTASQRLKKGVPARSSGHQKESLSLNKVGRHSGHMHGHAPAKDLIGKLSPKHGEAGQLNFSQLLEVLHSLLALHEIKLCIELMEHLELVLGSSSLPFGLEQFKGVVDEFRFSYEGHAANEGLDYLAHTQPTVSDSESQGSALSRLRKRRHMGNGHVSSSLGAGQGSQQSLKGARDGALAPSTKVVKAKMLKGLDNTRCLDNMIGKDDNQDDGSRSRKEHRHAVVDSSVENQVNRMSNLSLKGIEVDEPSVDLPDFKEASASTTTSSLHIRPHVPNGGATSVSEGTDSRVQVVLDVPSSNEVTQQSAESSPKQSPSSEQEAQVVLSGPAERNSVPQSAAQETNVLKKDAHDSPASTRPADASTSRLAVGESKQGGDASQTASTSQLQAPKLQAGDASTTASQQPGASQSVLQSVLHSVNQARKSIFNYKAQDDSDDESDDDDDDEEEDEYINENATKLHKLANPDKPWIIHPHSPLRIGWDLVGFVLIIVEAIIIPLSVGFDIEATEGWHVTTMCFFSMDLILSFVTGYFCTDGILVMRQWMIVRRYARGFFLIDFISTFPWEYALVGTSSGDASAVTRAARLAKLMRLMRMVRLLKLQSILARLEDVLPYAGLAIGLSLLKVLGFFLLLCHWSACVWGLIGSPEKIGHDSRYLDDYDTSLCAAGGPCEPTIMGSPWIKRYGLTNLTPYEKYLAALVFTTGLITGNEGGMAPGYVLERIYAIVMMDISFIMCSLIMSEMVVVVQKIRGETAEFQESMRVMREFMVSRKVPLILQGKIKRYLEFQFDAQKHGRGFDRNAVTDTLSPWLRLELTEHLNREIIARHPFFQQMPAKVLKRVCALANVVLYAPGDVVVQRGHRAACMFFVVTGQLRILRVKGETSTDDSYEHQADNVEGEVKDKEHSSVTLEEGSWIGDICLFKETVRSNTVMAVTNAELLTVGVHEFHPLVQEFPKVQLIFEEWQVRVLTEGTSGLSCQHCGGLGHSTAECPSLANALQSAVPAQVAGRSDPRLKKSKTLKNRIKSLFSLKISSEFTGSNALGSSLNKSTGFEVDDKQLEKHLQRKPTILKVGKPAPEASKPTSVSPAVLDSMHSQSEDSD